MEWSRFAIYLWNDCRISSHSCSNCSSSSIFVVVRGSSGWVSFDAAEGGWTQWWGSNWPTASASHCPQSQWHSITWPGRRWTHTEWLTAKRSGHFLLLHFFCPILQVHIFCFHIFVHLNLANFSVVLFKKNFCTSFLFFFPASLPDFATSLIFVLWWHSAMEYEFIVVSG